MLFLKYILIVGGIAMMATAVGILVYDLRREWQYKVATATGMRETLLPAPQLRWRASLALALLAWGPIILALGIVVVPSGMAGVVVSQTSGTLPGTLCPGAHFVVPLAESVVLFNVILNRLPPVKGLTRCRGAYRA